MTSLELVISQVPCMNFKWRVKPTEHQNRVQTASPHNRGDLGLLLHSESARIVGIKRPHDHNVQSPRTNKKQRGRRRSKKFATWLCKTQKSVCKTFLLPHLRQC